jgi:hypothetical protein
MYDVYENITNWNTEHILWASCIAVAIKKWTWNLTQVSKEHAASIFRVEQ